MSKFVVISGGHFKLLIVARNLGAANRITFDLLRWEIFNFPETFIITASFWEKIKKMDRDQRMGLCISNLNQGRVQRLKFFGQPEEQGLWVAAFDPKLKIHERAVARMIYADWLEETGQGNQAKTLRKTVNPRDLN